MRDHICVVGLQWGDEGKGKIVDTLSGQVDVVVRFQGGGNAGHTVWVDGKKYVTHHIPIGVLHDDVTAVLGNGMVIDPKRYMEEYETLTEDQKSRVRISDRAHLILSRHVKADIEHETSAGKVVFGSTRRGIGPAYQDKYARFGVRVGDLHRPGFFDTVDESDRESLKVFYEANADKITDTVSLLHRLDKGGASIMFEGAQGVLLDIDLGQYPYVTSSHCTMLGVGAGTGFSPRRIKSVIGVVKAYPTRIGTGPFPTFADPVDDEALRQAGSEFGATTGRPRKCGWLDIPALRYAIQVSDVDEIALTKTDILSGRKELPVCIAYELDGRKLGQYPSDTETISRVKPIYEMWSGWEHATMEEMEPFILDLEAMLECPVTMIGCGPDRKDVILRQAW